MSLTLMIVALAGSGALAGVLAGLLGIGGGIVLVPVFAFVFAQAGYDGPDLMQVCLATSLSTIIVTSARSVMANHKRGAVDWGILRSWAPFIALGAIAAVAAVASLRSSTLQAIFSVLVLVIAAWMVFGRREWKLADEMPRGLARAAMAAATGFISVLIGIGGGSIGVPIMTLHGRPIHSAVATAAGFGGLIAAPSVIVFLFVPAQGAPPWTLGSVNLAAFALTIAMTLLTAPLGAALAHRTDPTRLRRIFALFLVLVAVNMLRKSLT